MNRRFAAILGALALSAASSAPAQQPVKIGLIMPYSGQFADAATQMDNAIKLYMKQHGDTVAGRKLEIIRRDTGGVAPDIAKRHAQELVVRDKVDILAGFVLTPNALAAADVSAEAKKFMVVMNAATAIITTKSPYMARTSLTVPQLNETFGAWAHRSGIHRLYTMVSDYGPGHDAEGAFQRAFKEAGGEVVGSVRIPVANPDFFPFVQRAKDLNPEAVFVFIPGGAQPAAFGKALVDLGVDSKKTRILGQGEITEENALRVMGDAALGLITAFHYDHNHKQDRRRGSHRGRQGHEMGKPARRDRYRSGDSRHRPDGLYPPCRESRRPAAQRRDRQDRERQGPGQGADEEIARSSRHKPADDVDIDCRIAARAHRPHRVENIGRIDVLVFASLGKTARSPRLELSFVHFLRGLNA